MIPYPLSELLDRISICKLKLDRLNECKLEYDFLVKGLSSYNFDHYDEYINRLYDINSQIWDLEHGIRNTSVTNLEEIGRRTLLIREKNKIRIQVKNEIVDVSNSGFKDIKMNHLSG